MAASSAAKNVALLGKSQHYGDGASSIAKIQLYENETSLTLKR